MNKGYYSSRFFNKRRVKIFAIFILLVVFILNLSVLNYPVYGCLEKSKIDVYDLLKLNVKKAEFKKGHNSFYIITKIDSFSGISQANKVNYNILKIFSTNCDSYFKKASLSQETNFSYSSFLSSIEKKGSGRTLSKPFQAGTFYTDPVTNRLRRYYPKSDEHRRNE